MGAMLAEVPPLRSPACRSSRSILLVAHVTPPTTMSAARRAAGLTKYLARLGHRVTVLTSVMSGLRSGSGRGRDHPDPRPAGQPAELAPERASPRSRGRPQRAYAGSAERAGGVGGAGPRNRRMDPRSRCAAGLALARREHFDCVITTSPAAVGTPDRPRPAAMGHPLGGGPSRRLVASSPAPALGAGSAGPARPQARAHRCQPRRRRVGSHAADRRTIWRERFGRAVTTITNGFDPEMSGGEPQAGRTSSDELLTPGAADARPHRDAVLRRAAARPLWMRFRHLQQTAPGAAARHSRSRSSGRHRLPSATWSSGRAYPTRVRLTGLGPARRALALQRAADGLLGDHRAPARGRRDRKALRVLRGRRPILVHRRRDCGCADRHAGGRRRSRSRATIRGARAALRRCRRGRDELPPPDREAVEPFAYPALAAADGRRSSSSAISRRRAAWHPATRPRRVDTVGRSK